MRKQERFVHENARCNVLNSTTICIDWYEIRCCWTRIEIVVHSVHVRVINAPIFIDIPSKRIGKWTEVLLVRNAVTISIGVIQWVEFHASYGKTKTNSVSFNPYCSRFVSRRNVSARNIDINIINALQCTGVQMDSYCGLVR